MTENKKVVIPKFVAEWVVKNKLSSDLIQLYEEVEYATDADGFIEGKWDYSGELYDWIVSDTDNIYKLADALRYGYEIEKEKLYYVALPFLGYMTNSFDFPLTKAKEDGAKSTEQQIKSIDERYWAFAVEVEG